MTNEEAIRLIDDMRRNAIGLMLEKKQIDALDKAIEALKAQDDSLNEWCTDCKEYDTEKHCCPRFNKVIRTALSELPSAEPDIIACGDCKHYICHDRRCGYWNHGVKPLEWCCHAERRGGA